MRKRSRIALLLLSLAVVISTIYMIVTSPRRRLDTFLRDVATVEVGKTRFDEWLAQLERDQHLKFRPRCDGGSCSIAWSEENKLLRTLHLAPRTLARATVEFSDGVASKIHINLWTMKRNESGQWDDDKGVVIVQTMERSSACHLQYTLEREVRAIHGGEWARITMDSCVSSENLARALAINPSCLTRIGGCKTVEEMLPQVLGHQ
jgi:hypothetical protein